MEEQTIKIGVAEGVMLWRDGDKHPPHTELELPIEEALKLEAGGHVYFVEAEGVDNVDSGYQPLLVQVIACLDPNKKNKADWTRSGFPNVKTLEEITGEALTASMRDEAYSLYLKTIGDE